VLKLKLMERCQLALPGLAFPGPSGIPTGSVPKTK
jgi:hypothetical protein